jgi:hypothetical protein
VSTFYCTAHAQLEDSDFVGYHVTESGDEMCTEAADEMHGGFDGRDEDGFTDAEADADTLASAGWGTDEDYGGYCDDSSWDSGW